ncbi:hypothetical protein [Paenibacillus tundrae]|uniref:Transposase n=1 Tax=Paenibacillus tundrae TaxID=528187 RepID=A0ABT9WL53_9BACL|nr:hypothetical protein [Paenibacillus tundrae]MDQ0173732.1 hypothetical protein [Paenibacillus tundrae]
MVAEPENKATFYQYRLLKKKVIARSVIYSYLCLPVIMLFFNLLAFSWMGLLSFVLAGPITIWIHYVIARTILLLVRSSYTKRWRWSIRMPWLGYIPDQHFSYRMFVRVHFNICWIGLCIITVCLIWSPLSFTFALIFWHIWLLVPRLYVILFLSRERKDGLIKLTNQDVSYYLQ